MSKQVITGKAFEYSLLIELFLRLRNQISIEIVENESYWIAKNCFESFSDEEKGLYRLNSSQAINFLIDLEPRIVQAISQKDVLQLQIMSDSEGQIGDVRDILVIRSNQNWEIGISAKNNHRAVKHSRLSQHIDFGSKWMGIPCSLGYFEEIRPVFQMLEELRRKGKQTKWSSIPNMHEVVYLPILIAFKKELLRLYQENSEVVPTRLVEYLIGKNDFYKVIKGKNKVEIHGYNLHGTLNQSIGDFRPKANIKKLKLPTRLVEVVFEQGSYTTLLVSFNEGWSISFRIHNASSRVEPSLKFDINLISSPHSLFTNHIFLGAQ